MAAVEDLVEEFPEPARSYLRQLWASLPEEQRKQLELIIAALPVSARVLKRILSYAAKSWGPVLGAVKGRQRTIAIVGPANVGKSTLYNHLITRKEDQARVGPIPGTTRENQQAETGIFTLIDTPGADAVGEVGERERGIAFEAARNADFLVIMFETTRGIKRYEQEMFDGLRDLGKPYIVVLNKMDMIDRHDRNAVREAAARNLGLEPSQIIETTAHEGKGIKDVVLAIAALDPQLVIILAQAVKAHRTELSQQQIIGVSVAAGIVGATPIPIADLVPLLALQAGMILTLAGVWGYKISLVRARELLATFGAGVLARELFRQLAKLGGVPGWILSAAIAGGTTYAMGYAAMVWFSTGERMTREAVEKLARELAEYLKDQLLSLGKRRPERQTLRKRIEEILRNLPGRLRLNPDDDQPVPAATDADS